VREFVAHGVGVGPHESPQIPNFADGWSRNQVNCRLRPGMTLALEPMITNVTGRSLPGRRLDGKDERW
jgi:methionyl aminopeptidase